MITVLVSPEALLGRFVELSGDTHHHLFRVRRVASGERLRLVDGAGAARFGEIVRIGRADAVVALGEPAPAREPLRRLELFVAPPRPDRLAWLVEKATELGVAALRFVATARDPRALGAGSLERLRRVASAALEQCGGARLPAISGVHAAEELPGLLAPLRERRVLDPGGAPLASGLAANDAALALLVGPEGGWSDEERARLASFGCVAAGLGERTLRVETAAIAGAALVLLAGETPAKSR